MALANGGYGESLIPLVGQAEQVAASMQARRLRDLQEQRAQQEATREAADWQYKQTQQNRGDAIRQKWAEAQGDLDAFKRNGGFGLMDPQLGMQLEDVFTKRANAQRDRRELEGQREALAKRFEGFQGANPEQFVMPGTPAYFEEPAGVGAALSSSGAKYASGAPMPQYGAIGEDGLPVEPMGAQTPPPQTSVRTINTFADIAGANTAYDESQADAAEMQGMGSLARAGIFDNRFGDAWKVISEEEKRPLLRAKEARAEATAAAKERAALIKEDLKTQREELKTAATLAMEEYKQGKMDARQFSMLQAQMTIADKRLAAAESAMELRGSQAEAREAAKDTRQGRSNALRLKSGFRSDQRVKDYTTVRQYAQQVEQMFGTDNRNKSMSDQVLGSSFNKLLDPNSVVMPSEFARVFEFSPLGSQIQGKLEQVIKGGAKFTDAERNEIRRIAKEIYGLARTRFGEVSYDYTLDASELGASPRLIIGMDATEAAREHEKRIGGEPATPSVLPAAHKSKQSAPPQGPTTIRYDAQGRRIP